MRADPERCYELMAIVILLEEMHLLTEVYPLLSVYATANHHGKGLI